MALLARPGHRYGLHLLEDDRQLHGGDGRDQRPNAVNANNLSGRVDVPGFIKDAGGGNGRGYQWLIPCNYSTTTFACTNAASPFQPSDAVSIGTLGRNTLRDMNSWNLDASLFRQFRISEAKNTQVRVEAFNVFNLRQFRGLSSTDLSSSSYGITTSTYNPRTLQLSARFTF